MMSEKITYTAHTETDMAWAKGRHEIDGELNGRRASIVTEQSAMTLIRPGILPTGHPVDVMLAMGFTIGPEDEARLRALCDEPVELSEGTK